MCKPLFDAIHEVKERIDEASHVLVCVDYDGALTHYAASPLGAHLSQQMERVLMSLAEHGRASLAIFSGRNRSDLQNRIGIPGLIYAGNHGLEISGPGFLFVEPMAALHVAAFEELTQLLTAELAECTGVIVQDKGLTISVHYRQVRQEDRNEIGRRVATALAGASYPFVLSRGERVFEIRPAVGWTKGSALRWIKDRLPDPDVLVLYVGDDITDEDAFRAIADAITIKVGEASATAARYKLNGPAEVRKLLEWLDEALEHQAFAHAEVGAKEMDLEATVY